MDGARFAVLAVHVAAADAGGAHGVVETGLLCESEGLLVCSGTSDDGIFTVKVLGHLLERRVARLDVEEVDDDQLDGQPGAIDDVVLPANLAESDGVDIRVEEDCEVNC